MTYPVAVVATCRSSRKWFFEQYCLPSIMVNGPCQVLVEQGDSVSAERLEAAARKTKMVHVAFVNDDEILGAEFLATMLRALRKAPKATYAHCGFLGIQGPKIFECLDRDGAIASSFVGIGGAAGTAMVVRKDPWLAKKRHIGVNVPGVHFMKFLAAPE